MGDYGAAVSQKGYDVKNCADRFLVYSSAFSNLKINSVSSVSTTKPTTGNTNTITITHNLGYLAPVMVVYNGSTTLGVNSSFLFTDSIGSVLSIKIYTNTIEIIVGDDFDGSASAAGDTVYFTVYSFLDSFDTIAASSINTGTSSGSSSTDYGIRVSKAGFDVKSCDDKDCAFSSSFFSNIVHMKGVDDTGEVTHDLGYIPAFLGFYKVSGNSFLSLEDYSGYFMTFAVNTSTITSNLDTGDEFYYVILKQKLV